MLLTVRSKAVTTDGVRGHVGLTRAIASRARRRHGLIMGEPEETAMAAATAAVALAVEGTLLMRGGGISCSSRESARVSS